MLHLFDAFGIELEYMIVDRDTLDIRPIADEVLRDDRGQIVSDVERGAICWSNELTRHVIELKTSGPAPSLSGLAAEFQKNVEEINARLAPHNAMLLPTGMHPWMDPHQEMELWPHDNHVIYDAFHKVFDCRGHGFANLQSMHINLPFANDEEFGRLHAAIRLVLPLLPGLAASSPLMEGRLSGFMDSRLEVYRTNTKGVASVTGRVIPEPVFTQAEYDKEIFQPMYRDIAPYDPDGVLRQEFLNSRGAIARFSRGAIEIRVLDVQECPAADLAIAELVIEFIRKIVNSGQVSLDFADELPIDLLEPLFLDAIRRGDRAVLDNYALSYILGIRHSAKTLRELWQEIASKSSTKSTSDPDRRTALEVYRREGCLARRITRALGENPDRARQQEVYRRLAECLAQGKIFSNLRQR